MLVGTTFAWFTDSVTSANNIIKSGNLDVELYYQAEGQTDWTKVTETTNVFKQNALWEPGHTEVVKLKIVNEGSLALKYNLGVNVASEVGSVNVNDEAFKLSDFIKFGIVDGAQTYTRDQAIAAVDATATALKTAYNSGATALAPAAESIVTMVVYMPTSVGNEANAKKGAATPTINLGINLLATQQMAEEDSFGADYDKGAAWDGIVPDTMPETLVVDGDTLTVHVKDAYAFAYLSTLSSKWAELYTDGNGNEWINYANGAGENYYYSDRWTVSLEADINLLNCPIEPVVIKLGESTGPSAFDGKGHTISNVVVKNGQTALFNSRVDPIKNLTVENIVVNAPDATRVAAISNMGALENVHVVNANVIGGKYVGGLVGQGSNIINCSIKNSVIVGTDKTVGGLVGYCSGDPDQASATGNVVENVTVTGAYNVGGMFGQAQNVNVDGNTVKNATVISTKALPANASSNEVRTAALAARSAFANTTIGSNTVENVACGIEVYGLTLIPNGENSKIIVNDKEGFLNLTKLSADWRELFTDGNGNEWINYANGA
jgi:predicted ribosomally synthesized peptide with SipW-like signal peptide